MQKNRMIISVQKSDLSLDVFVLYQLLLET